MQDETKMLTDMYLGGELPQKIYEVHKETAVRKLKWIISQEGDAGGERRKPYYLAQLIAEAFKNDVFKIQCMIAYEDKKRAIHHKMDNSLNQPHYSSLQPELSSVNC